MQTFQFQITQRYVNLALKIVTPYWVEVNYEVVDNKVVVIDVKIPYEILTYLNGYHLGNDIYYAAENNHASNKAAQAEQQSDLFKDMGVTDKPINALLTIHDHFKFPVTT